MGCSLGSSHGNKHDKEMKGDGRGQSSGEGGYFRVNKVEAQKPYRGMVLGPFSCKGLGKDGVRSSEEAEAGSSQTGYGHPKTSAEPAQYTLTCTCQICHLSGVALLLGRSHTYLSRQRPQPTSQPQSTAPGRAHLVAPTSLDFYVLMEPGNQAVSDSSACQAFKH